MVAAFVRAEFDSARFKAGYRDGLRALGVGRGGLIDNADLANQKANQRRRFLLRFRGYPDDFLFRGWPSGVEWRSVRLSLDELATTRYANYDTWIRLSGGTRLIREGAANVDKITVAENANAHIKSVANLVREGLRFPELILVGRSLDQPFVLMEGHTRATAYLLAGAPDSVDCLLGTSPGMAGWAWWGTP